MDTNKQQTDVKVLDAVMGSGKTTHIIEQMNRIENRDRKYIYITPNLTECERIAEACPMLDFKHPQVLKGSKLKDLQRLVSEEQNIVSTHAMVKNFTKETLELIINNNYHLVIDEAVDPCVKYDITSTDIKVLFDSGLVGIADDGITLEWLQDRPEHNFKYFYEYKLIQNENLVMFDFKSKSKCSKVFICEMTKAFFESFLSVTVLTYQFEGSPLRAYFDLKGIGYEIDTKSLDRGIKLGHLIHVYDNKDLNDLGNHQQAMGKTHMTSKRGSATCERLSNNIYNFVNNKVKTPSRDVMWTTFKDCKDKVKAKGFVIHNQKATNDYANKTTLAYGLNLFMNSSIKSYYVERGIDVNEDLWALNEMLQWIFRSAIRNGEEIHVYVPSSRMRGLLLEWKLEH